MTQPEPAGSETTPASEAFWIRTPFANLIRYVPSRMYFARIRVKGKLVRKSLKTDVLSVANLRLADLEKAERQLAERTQKVTKGRMTFGDALAAYRQRIESDRDHKPSLLRYRREFIAAIIRYWPRIEARDVRTITGRDCQQFADQLKEAR